MQHIRLATQEEVEKIRGESDLGQIYTVFARENRSGDTNLAVLKQVVELDPVHYAESSSVLEKTRFVFDLEERMLGAGVQHYYFNIAAEDAGWQKVVKEWGAVQQSHGPELRFGRSLR